MTVFEHTNKGCITTMSNANLQHHVQWSYREFSDSLITTVQSDADLEKTVPKRPIMQDRHEPQFDRSCTPTRKYQVWGIYQDDNGIARISEEDIVAGSLGDGSRLSPLGSR